jgi:hypothetical protein
MLHIRDDAFAALGRAAPVFHVTSVQENPAPEFRRRIKGTFEVPLYLTGTGQPGQRFDLDANGLPQRQMAAFTATFTCNMPQNDSGLARMSLYGHGLLGSQDEVNGSLVRKMSQTYNVAYCATNWIGLAEEDIFNAVQILTDLSRFPSLADRLQQGFLNFLFLGRLMRHPNGFVSDPAFQAPNGVALMDINELYYDGNSQGAITGGALCSMARDFRRCVLAEAGMNYSTLLQRSVDFDTYQAFLNIGYPDHFVQLVALNLTQMLWDRGETNGYAEHITRAPYPHTPRKTVLLLGAVGDHQVSEFSLQVEARTIGAAGHVPYVAPDREIGGEHGFGIKPIPTYPWHRSAYFLWDTGAALSPLENVPPSTGHDPHDDTPKIPAVQALKDAFWHRNGVVQDVCAGAPCTGPQF